MGYFFGCFQWIGWLGSWMDWKGPDARPDTVSFDMAFNDNIHILGDKMPVKTDLGAYQTHSEMHFGYVVASCNAWLCKQSSFFFKWKTTYRKIIKDQTAQNNFNFFYSAIAYKYQV